MNNSVSLFVTKYNGTGVLLLVVFTILHKAVNLVNNYFKYDFNLFDGVVGMEFADLDVQNGIRFLFCIS